jgi:hypothetical protein
MARTFGQYHLSLEHMLYGSHPGVVRLFPSTPPDFKTKSPFAQAFMCKVRSILGFFKGLAKLVEKNPSIITQANEAAVYHVKKKYR